MRLSYLTHSGIVETADTEADGYVVRGPRIPVRNAKCCNCVNTCCAMCWAAYRGVRGKQNDECLLAYDWRAAEKAWDIRSMQAKKQ